MNPELPHGLIIDLYFDSETELTKALSVVFDVSARYPFIYELNLRLHWQPHTLSLSNYEICKTRIEKMRARNPDLNILCKLPFCVAENAQYASFPDCDSCVFLESGWCHWPRQIGRGYYNVPQANFNPDNFKSIVRRDFETSAPLTWYYPARAQFQMAAHQLEKSPTIVDFGSGNGFVGYLLQKEFQNQPQLLAIEPNVKPDFSHPSIQHLKSLPDPMPQDWSLFSSLADFYVPLDECLRQKHLPRDVVLILFPDVFGKGGFRIQIEIHKGEIKTENVFELFDLHKLSELGYTLIHHEKVNSHFYNNTEFRIYSRKDKELLKPAKNIRKGHLYPWENSSACKKSQISTLDLS